MNEIYDLIIVGGGPGGIGVAVESKILGIKKIMIIEKGCNHSQTIRKFYKDQKRVDKDWQGKSVELLGNIDFKDGTKESTLNYFDSLLDNHLIEAKFNCEVDSVKKENDLFMIVTTCGTFTSKNIVISVGKMGKPNMPAYSIPLSLKTIVNFNLDRCGNGESILVVGGGDSAVEYACELSKTNEVTLTYRRDMLTRPNPTNQEMFANFLDDDLLSAKFGVDIVALENERGKAKVFFDNDESEVYDRIIYAIGGSTPLDFLKKCAIALNEKLEPIFDENYETPTKGLYIAGDIAFKSGGSIAIALNHGHKIATHILAKV
ncbi:MAG: NAD(P)-binding domain-containing protein [Campylobacterales bacterium]|nr:NAD(P)-binding domain-containing protein [Campylobacterales bacterium]